MLTNLFVSLDKEMAIYLFGVISISSSSFLTTACPIQPRITLFHMLTNQSNTTSHTFSSSWLNALTPLGSIPIIRASLMRGGAVW